MSDGLVCWQVGNAINSTFGRRGCRSTGSVVRSSLRQSTQLFHWTRSDVLGVPVFVAYDSRTARDHTLAGSAVLDRWGLRSLDRDLRRPFDTFAVSVYTTIRDVSPVKRSKSNNDLTNQPHRCMFASAIAQHAETYFFTIINQHYTVRNTLRTVEHRELVYQQK